MRLLRLLRHSVLAGRMIHVPRVTRLWSVWMCHIRTDPCRQFSQAGERPWISWLSLNLNWGKARAAGSRAVVKLAMFRHYSMPHSRWSLRCLRWSLWWSRWRRHMGEPAYGVWSRRHLTGRHRRHLCISRVYHPWRRRRHVSCDRILSLKLNAGSTRRRRRRRRLPRSLITLDVHSCE